MGEIVVLSDVRLERARRAKVPQSVSRALTANKICSAFCTSLRAELRPLSWPCGAGRPEYRERFHR